ncbi:MAG TPA: YetF domain-containing protein [Opitutaceae bacterium]|nr:YetF domain-containing protein [Opitutaceae bacterium]
MNWIYDQLTPWLGLDAQPKDFTWYQLLFRALIIFIAALAMLRIAHKRFFAGKNAIDVLLTFILASTLSRAINGSGPFFGTIFTGFVLIFLHSIATQLACRFEAFGEWIKGHSATVVRDGVVDETLLRKHHLSRRDLAEDLHLNGGTTDLAKVREAVLERSGDISIVRKTQVFTISVQEGVQTVRIEVEG